MNNLKYRTALLCTVLLAAALQPAAARKKNDSLEVKKTAYEKFLSKGACTTARGSFITLHKMRGKLYAEVPVKYLGRDMLIASTTAESSNSKLATVGYKAHDPMCVCLNRIDSTVVMQEVNTGVEADKELSAALNRNYASPILKKYKIETYNNDSSAVVIDMTEMFTGDEKSLCPVEPNYSILAIKPSLQKNMSILGDIKAFDDNVQVGSTLTYDYSLTFMGSEVANGKLTTKVNRTILLLPEKPMKPRIADSRVGTFLTSKTNISMENDGIESYSYANRWRLEPSDTAAWLRGELVEPVKPIVWYIDDAFPEGWKEPLKRSVTIWNKAFERIGFKNVMRAEDFPKNDSLFDPDNLKYSCIRYVPIAVKNAKGPSWVDPRSGEIINASVLVYNDVIKLINNWRFVQTAQIDTRVRTKKMPKEVMDESLTYAFAHEIGHTLGLMHNMGASHAIPVDSLRSPSFTAKYGTTPSIMDYARYNYVAQPEDKGVRLSPPDLGVYDEYVIRWLYTPLKGDLRAKEEAKELEKWVDEKAGDPFYRYGRQQVYARYDPSALEEDLGDDAMKAGDYGLKNLKYILKNMDGWIQDDESTAHKQELYDGICQQFNRYMTNVMANVGGIYITEVKDGTNDERLRPVDAATQHASMMWTIRQLRNSDWLDEPSLTRKFPLGVKRSIAVKSNIGKKLLSLNNRVLLSSHISDIKAYTQKDYYTDLYNGIFEPSIKNRKLTDGEKLLQRQTLNEIVGVASKVVGKNGLKTSLSSDISVFAPDVDDIVLYGLDNTGYVAENLSHLRKTEEEYGRGYVSTLLPPCEFGDKGDYAFQNEVKTDIIDESLAYSINFLTKAKRLFTSRLGSCTAADKPHYQAMLAIVKAVEK